VTSAEWHGINGSTPVAVSGLAGAYTPYNRPNTTAYADPLNLGPQPQYDPKFTFTYLIGVTDTPTPASGALVTFQTPRYYVALDTPCETAVNNVTVQTCAQANPGSGYGEFTAAAFNGFGSDSYKIVVNIKLVGIDNTGLCTYEYLGHTIENTGAYWNNIYQGPSWPERPYWISLNAGNTGLTPGDQFTIQKGVGFNIWCRMLQSIYGTYTGGGGFNYQAGLVDRVDHWDQEWIVNPDPTKPDTLVKNNTWTTYPWGQTVNPISEVNHYTGAQMRDAGRPDLMYQPWRTLIVQMQPSYVAVSETNGYDPKVAGSARVTSGIGCVGGTGFGSPAMLASGSLTDRTFYVYPEVDDSGPPPPPAIPETGLNGIWELLSETEEPASEPVNQVLESRMLFGDSPGTIKNLRRCDLQFSGIKGDLAVKVRFRPAHYPFWVTWDQFTLPETRATRPWGSVKDRRSPVLQTRTPPDTVDELTGRPLSVGPGFQVRVEWTGVARLDYFQVFQERTGDMAAFSDNAITPANPDDVTRPPGAVDPSFWHTHLTSPLAGIV